MSQAKTGFAIAPKRRSRGAGQNASTHGRSSTSHDHALCG